VPVIQLRDQVAKPDDLAADAGKGKLRFGLGEQHGWPLSPEQRKSHGHSGYLCWW
jgi:hypothetical protein